MLLRTRHSPTQVSTVGEPSDLHPWLKTLNAFNIPFFCYSSEGHQVFTSRSAREMCDTCAPANSIAVQAGSVAIRELAEERPQRGLGQLSLRKEIPGVGSIVLSIHLGPVIASRFGAVVVIRPGVPAIHQTHAFAGLSQRELDVANLVAAGLATKEVAFRLKISPHTARHHTEKVFSKLGVRTRAAVASVLTASTATRAPSVSSLSP